MPADDHPRPPSRANEPAAETDATPPGAVVPRQARLPSPFARLLGVLAVLVVVGLALVFGVLRWFKGGYGAWESTTSLRLISDQSSELFRLDGGFPSSTPMYPTVEMHVARCNAGYDMFPGDAPVWRTDATWAGLSFAMSDSHRYSYQYDSSRTGDGATFTASAFGDLDCDGRFSTFVRFGAVVDGEVRPSNGFYIQNEWE